MHLTTLLRRALLGDVPNGFFQDNRERLCRKNLRTLRLGLNVALPLCIILFVASFFLTSMEPRRPIYILLCAGNLLGLLAVQKFLPQHICAAAPTLYGFALFWDVAALLLGTVYMPQDSAASFFLIVIVSGVLTLGRPIYSIGIQAGVNVAFLVVSAVQKASFSVAVQMDAIHCVFSFLLGVAFSSYIINIRLKNLQMVQVFRARSETDALTGLSNKQAIDQMCRACFRPDRTSGCAMMMVDIDDFKQINDTQGHAVGDEVLHSVGLTMHAMFREDDIIGRFGGDEFLVVMKNIANAEDVRIKAERLHGRIADIVACGRPLDCSIGVALAAPGDGMTFEELFSQADMALYSSKSSGKGRVTLYRPEGGEISGEVPAENEKA